MWINKGKWEKSPWKTHIKDEQIWKKNERFMKIMIICKHIKKIIHHIKCTHEMKQKYKVECRKYTITKHKYRHIYKHTYTHQRSKWWEKEKKISKREKWKRKNNCWWMCANNFCFMRWLSMRKRIQCLLYWRVRRHQPRHVFTINEIISLPRKFKHIHPRCFSSSHFLYCFNFIRM